MECPSCGGFIGLSDRVCPKCRHRLVATPTAAVPPANPLGAQCPHCGTSNQAASGACTHCGKDLRQRSPQPPPGLGPVTKAGTDLSASPEQNRQPGFLGAGSAPRGVERMSERSAPGFRWNCHECDKDNNENSCECVYCGHRYCQSCRVYLD